MVTDVPPAGRPAGGLTAVTTGPAWKLNWSPGATLVPLGVVTVTSTMPPAGSAGDVAVIDVADTTSKEATGVEPNMTALAPSKLVPVMDTGAGPGRGAGRRAHGRDRRGRLVGEQVGRVGGAGPEGRGDGRRLPWPPRWAGAVTVICVPEMTEKVVAGAEPNAMALAR